MNEETTVAAGSAVRLRYFDHAGAMRTAVILSTVPADEVRQRAAEIRRSIEAYTHALGGIVVDVQVDLEDRDELVDLDLEGRQPVRGAGFLRLATASGSRVPGTGVDLIISDQDETWAPTDLAALEAGSTYG